MIPFARLPSALGSPLRLQTKREIAKRRCWKTSVLMSAKFDDFLDSTFTRDVVSVSNSALCRSHAHGEDVGSDEGGLVSVGDDWRGTEESSRLTVPGYSHGVMLIGAASQRRVWSTAAACAERLGGAVRQRRRSSGPSGSRRPREPCSPPPSSAFQSSGDPSVSTPTSSLKAFRVIVNG